MKAAGTAAVKLFFVHAGSVKQGRIVNYHGRGRKKTAKIAAQTRAVGAHLADPDIIARANLAGQHENIGLTNHRQGRCSEIWTLS